MAIRNLFYRMIKKRFKLLLSLVGGETKKQAVTGDD